MLSDEINNPYGNTLFSKGSKHILDMKNMIPTNNIQLDARNSNENLVENLELNKVHNNRYNSIENNQSSVNKESSNLLKPSGEDNIYSNSSKEFNFGIIHDKYLISSEINPNKSRLSPSNKSLLNPETNKNRVSK